MENSNATNKDVELEAMHKSEMMILNAIKNPAIELRPHEIKYVQNLSKDLLMEILQTNGFIIKYIENPSEELQLMSVNRHCYTIKYIKNPSKNVQLAAVKQYSWAIDYIRNPRKDVVITVILKSIQKGNYDYAIKLIEKYDDNNWPELNIIKTSLRADGKLL